MRGCPLSAWSDLIGVLLPGGIATAMVLIFNAVKSWREGRHTREETVLQYYQRIATEEEDARKIAEQDEAFAIILADYWRQCYADLVYEARKEGLNIPQRPVIPEKKRVRSGTETRRKLERSRRPRAPDEDIE
jgi:formyltetrahydrofolate hydrolase